MIKKPLFVTLADKSYLEYAKQVFAGAYFNAGWQGDYMLLAYDCTKKDKEWFKKKGILVKQFKPLFSKPVAMTPLSYLTRLYLFTPEFKKWSHIIYVDADIIIRASLDKLLEIKGFASVDDILHGKLKSELIGQKEARYNRGISKKLYIQLKRSLVRKYNLEKNKFCAGFFAFNTNVIKANSFKDIVKIIKKFHWISTNADQFALNIYFDEKRESLPPVYDVYLLNGWNQWNLSPDKIDGIILHFLGPDKPWDSKNEFYNEWRNNYLKADRIDLTKISEGKQWSKSKVQSFSYFLKKRETILNFNAIWYFYRLNQVYFTILHSVERNFPSFFKILKTVKAKFRSLIQ